MSNVITPFDAKITIHTGQTMQWGGLYGSSYGLVISQAARQADRLLVVITPDTPTANQLEYDIRFYGGGSADLPG